MTLCEPHGRLRCGECAYVDELQERIQSLQQQVNTLTEALSDLDAVLDFQETVLPGDVFEFEDIAGINKTMKKAHTALQSIKESPREEQME